MEPRGRTKRITTVTFTDEQRKAIEDASGKPGQFGALTTGILNLLKLWEWLDRPEVW